MREQRTYQNFVKKILITLGVSILLFQGCEFINDPFNPPEDEYSTEYFIQEGDSLVVSLEDIVDLQSAEQLSIESIDSNINNNIIEVTHVENEYFIIQALNVGETTIQLSCSSNVKAYKLYIKIIIYERIIIDSVYIEAPLLHLNMGEPYKYSLTELFDTTDNVCPDSFEVSYFNEDSVENSIFEYFTYDTLLITSIYPSEEAVLITGYFGEDLIINVLLNIFSEIRHVVLAELFTSTTCTNCPEANEIVSEYLDTYSSSMAVIRYHLGTPAPGDPMYAYNPEESDSRMYSYIPFPIAPFLTIDGSSPFVGVGPIENATATLIERIETSAEVYIGHDVIETSDSLGVSVHIYGNIDLTQYTLCAVLTENEVEYEGSNGETHHYQVMRDIDQYSIGESIVNIEMSLVKPDWYSEDEFSVVTFIQNTNSNEIIQANVNHKPLP